MSSRVPALGESAAMQSSGGSLLPCKRRIARYSRVPARRRKYRISLPERAAGDGLSDDILHEILLRLPVKTLRRFCCVSKTWNSLISHPSFLAEHQCRQNPLLLVAQNELDRDGFVTGIHFSTYSPDRGDLVNKFSKSVPKLRLTFHLIQSCHGLVCLGADLCNGPILVCNPKTQDLVTLPSRPFRGVYDQVGFGYATTSGEYKVVRFFVPDSIIYNCCCEVLTLGAHHGWREATSPPFRPRQGSPFLNGALHLLPAESPLVQDRDYIAVFDINTEEYRQGIPLPDVYFGEGRDVFAQISEVSGSLCLTFDFVKTKGVVEFWILNNYGTGKWEKRYITDLFLADPNSDSYTLPLTIKVDGSLVHFVDSQGESEFRCHNFKGVLFTKKIDNLIHNDIIICSSVSYVEKFNVHLML